jgi:ferredoxin
VKVIVDRDLCQGHGVCESEAPEVFSVSKQGVLTVLDETPGDARRAELQQAVRFCPTGALRIEETGGDDETDGRDAPSVVEAD